MTRLSKAILLLFAAYIILMNFSGLAFWVSGIAVPAYWKAQTRDYSSISGRGYNLRLSPSLTEVDVEDIIRLKQMYTGQLENYFDIFPEPPMIVLLSREELNRALKEDYSMASAGAYHRGVILIGAEEVDKRFAGTLLHELGHYYVDIKAKGNFPIWYSEGLAQLMELKALDKLWFDAIKEKDYYMYSIEELSGDFYGLEDQVSAYRQALALVQSLEELESGQANLNILGELGRGIAFSEALKIHTGLSPKDLYEITFSD